MPRTTSGTLIDTLLDIKSFPVYLYEIEIKSRGSGTLGNDHEITDTTKAWISNEWVDDSSVYTDKNGDTFTVTSNTANIVTLNDDPAEGEYTLNRWLYLAQYSEEYVGFVAAEFDNYGGDAPGGFSPVEYAPTGVEGSEHDYIPYPITHSASQDYEVGSFPSISIELTNPGADFFNYYSAFERYDGLKGCILNILMVFIDDNGDIITGSGNRLIDRYVINQTTITDASITFSAQSLGNLSNKKIPSRVFAKTTCTWIYKDTKCKHSDLVVRPSGETISTCNKLLKSTLYSNLTLTWVSGVTSEVWSIDNLEDNLEEDILVGCLVELPGSGYLYEIIANSEDEITIDSYSRHQTLASEAYAFKVHNISIIDKLCCFGHNDTGKLGFTHRVQMEEDIPDVEIRNLTHNNMVNNGEFKTPLSTGWNASGTPSSTNALYFANPGLVKLYSGADGVSYGLLSQEVANSDTDFETGKQIDLVLRHYGHSNVISETTYLHYNVMATIGGVNYFWKVSSNSWVTGADAFADSGRNSILMRDYTYRIDSDELPYLNPWSFIRFDETICRFHTVFPSAVKGSLTSLSVKVYMGGITGSNKGTAYVDTVGMYVFNQNQHFGAFPGIPSKKYWLL